MSKCIKALLGAGSTWLLIDPPILTDCDGETPNSFGFSPGLGLLQVAKTIQYSGGKVEIVDLRAKDSSALLRDALEKIDFPPIVGISNQYFSTQNSTLQIVAFLQEFSPNTTVVVGGAHGGSIPREVWPDSVMVISGPFESFVGLEESFHGQYPLSLWPDVSSVIPVLEVTRGCVYNCDYCFRPSFQARQFEDIESDLDFILNNCEENRLIYGTYNLGTAPKLETQVLKRLAKEDFTGGIAQSRPDTILKLGREFLTLVIEAGLTNLSFGMESINPRSLRGHNKTKFPEKWLDSTVTCLKWCHELGIQAKLNVIIFESDSVADYENLLEFLRMNKNLISSVTAGPLMAFPRTGIFRKAPRSGTLTPNVAHYFSDKEVYPVNNASISFERSLQLTQDLMDEFPYTEILWKAADDCM